MAVEAKISDLLKEIKSGELMLPEFQRGFVWKRRQIKEYITSLYKGYPTGSFLVWKTPQPQKMRGEIRQTESKYYNLILDGQQRLTTIYVAFSGEAPPFYEGDLDLQDFNIYFNLQTEEFMYYKPSAMNNNIEWLSILDFFKKGLNLFLEEINKLPEVERNFFFKSLPRINKLDNIRNYIYYLKTITELDINQVVEVFNLVNSAGTDLSKADLALAHICSYWPEARGIFRKSQKKFKDNNFDFGLDFLTISISAIAINNVLFEKSFYTSDPELIKESWGKTEKILHHLINILKNDAYIDASDILKTPLVLIPMVTYLAKNNNTFINDKEKRQFLYWMYLALMWGRYSGRTYQTLQQDINVLNKPEPVQLLIGNIESERGRLEVKAEDLVLEGIRSRFYPMVYIVARSKGAVDWFNGVKLYSRNIGTNYQLQNHHIFPQAVLYLRDYKPTNSEDKRKVNEIANIAFLTQEANLKINKSNPLDYLEKVNKKYSGALRNQFVPEDKELWKVNKFEEFLNKRRQIIAEEINNFLSNVVKEGVQIKPPSIEEIIERGESENVEFKSSLRWDYKIGSKNKVLEYVIARNISAFMNTDGGTLIIGVDDEKNILGLEQDYSTLQKKNTDGFELHLIEIINYYIGKKYHHYINTRFEAVNKKEICIIKISPSHEPVYLKADDKNEFFIRAGNSTQPLDVKEANEYITLHWGS